MIFRLSIANLPCMGPIGGSEDLPRLGYSPFLLNPYFWNHSIQPASQPAANQLQSSPVPGLLFGLYRGSIANGENIANKTNGFCKFPFSLSLKNRKGKRLCRSITIHGELFVFHFHFRKTRKVCFIILGLMDVIGNP